MYVAGIFMNQHQEVVMQIYESLKKDHDTVKQLLSQLISLNESETKQRSVLVAQIRDELIPHSRAEEAVFYNSMRLLDETKSLAMHGYREHLEAETLLRTLQLLDATNLSWKETAYKLKESLEHHIEEEEGEMFAAAQGLFTAEEAVVLDEVFKKMKPEIKEEGLMMNTLEMVKNMMPPRLTDAISDLADPLLNTKKSNGASVSKH